MRSPVFLVAMAALGGCTAQGAESGGAVAAAADAHGAHVVHYEPAPAAGGVIRRGDSFAMMSRQYAPRAGAVAATGASAWVPPSPPPAFVVAALPPADPPAPPPAAVANRQPAATPAPAAAPASEIVRPEADAASAPAPDAALRAAGLELFNTNSCGACHILADAGAGGAVGPSLDNNPRLTRDYAIEVIRNGRGPMPSFGHLTDAEMGRLADYIVTFARK